MVRAHWMLLLGLLFAGLLTFDLIRGRSGLGQRNYDRKNNPLGYWTGIAVLLFLALLLLAGAAMTMGEE